MNHASVTKTTHVAFSYCRIQLQGSVLALASIVAERGADERCDYVALEHYYHRQDMHRVTRAHDDGGLSWAPASRVLL
jgi:hypothetical protein